MAHTLRLHDGDILDVSWSPGDVWLATASVDNTVVIWDVDKLPSTVAILKGHTGHVKGDIVGVDELILMMTLCRCDLGPCRKVPCLTVG